MTIGVQEQVQEVFELLIPKPAESEARSSSPLDSPESNDQRRQVRDKPLIFGLPKKLIMNSNP